MGHMDCLYGLSAVITSMDGKAKKKYTRLPGRGPRRGGFIAVFPSKCSLYLSDDHILAVDSNGFSEDYKRFYFSDIEGIITRKTKRGVIWSVTLALMITSSLTGALFLEVESFRILCWILSGTFLVFLIGNIVRGPTCICHIMTAVQEEKLPSLNRLRVARKVIGILRPAIEKAQGKLGPEEVKANESQGVVHPIPSMQNSRRSQGRKHQIRHYDGTMHIIAFALLLTDGLLTGINLLHHTPAMAVVSSFVTVMYCICIVVALVKQYGSDIPGTVRRVTWASLGFICVSYFLSYILWFTTIPTLMMRRPNAMITQWDMHRTMFDLSAQDSRLVMVVYVFAATFSLVLGALGLVRVKEHRDHSVGLPRPDQDSWGEVRV
jgi:UPF0716 family protein affecting phage T7 exclusion